MMKIYLSKDGVVRVPTAEEKSHYGMAKTILGGEWRGNTEDAYASMWQAGWVRVVETATKVNGEQYLNGKPVPFKQLPPEQRSGLRPNATQEEDSSSGTIRSLPLPAVKNFQ